MSRYNMQAIDAPQYSPRQPRRVDLPRQNIVRAYLLRMLFDFVVEGGNAAGRIFKDGLWRLLRHVQVRVGGRDVMSFSGQWLNLYLYVMGNEARIQRPPTKLDAGTREACELLAEIPLYMLHSLYPDEFGWPTEILPAPELVVTYGEASDLVTGEDGIVKLENVNVELYESFIDVDPMFPPRDPLSYKPIRVGQFEREIMASGAVSLALPELQPGDEVRAVFIEALAGGSGGTDYEYSDDLIETVRFKMSGRAVRETVPFAVIQSDNVVDYRLDEGAIPGLVVLDAAADKITAPGELWTVHGGTTPTLEMQVSKQAGDCKIRATVLYVRGRSVPVAG